MFRFVRWLRGSQPSAVAELTLQPEWVALEKAIHTRNFHAVSLGLRAWCRLPKSDLGQLTEAAKLALFAPLETSKLEILFAYYSNNATLAFDRSQTHMAEHGFDADLHVISLLCLYENNQFEDAYVHHMSVNSADLAQLNRPDYWQMASVIRWAANDMGALGQAANRALELAPDDAAILQTSLGMYIELGDQEKVTALQEHIANMPDAQGYSHSLCLLALGEYETGWQQMEGRYEIHDAHRYINQGLKAFPRWKGEPLHGQRLLLSAEQGLGDTIQMARYFPMMLTTGVKEIVLESQPEALTLLQYNFPDMKVVERRWAQAPALDFDLWIAMMSLPHHLKAWGKATPGRSGYLRVPPENAQYWSERVRQLCPSKKPKIGLAWSGQPSHRADRRRSIPFELMMRNLRGVNAVFFTLQTVVPQATPANVVNVSEEMITLADTAALIEQMDLVITVDTSIVHIAGALGKKTWLLLPKRYEWRWGLEGEENDWYESVKVIRQTEHANWASVLKDVFERRMHE